MPQKPFRTHVRSLPPANEEDAKRREALLESLLAPARRDHALGLLPELADADHEDVRLRLARAYVAGYRSLALTERDDLLIVEIARMAICEARDEGLYWNPVIDTLSRAQIIRSTPHPFTAKEFHDIHVAEELAARVAEWVAEQSDPAALYEVFEFRSSVVRTAAAMNLRVIDETLYRAITETDGHGPVALASNPHLPDAYRTRMASDAWSCMAGYRSLVQENAGADPRSPTWVQIYAKPVLAALAGSDPGLPEELRSVMIAHRQRIRSMDHDQLQILILDKGLTEQDVNRLLGRLDGENAIRVLAAGRASPADTRELLAKPLVARKLAEPDFESPPELLDMLARSEHGRDRLALVASHPRTSTKTLCWILQQPDLGPEIELRIADRAGTLDGEAELRARLVSPRHPVTAFTVLGNIKPTTAEYISLVESVASHDIAQAAAALEAFPPPPGTRLPKDLTTTLLKHPDASVRLIGITLLAPVRKTDPKPEKQQTRTR